MTFNRILGIWQILLIGSVGVFMNFHEFQIERKRTSGRRTYVGTLIAKYFTYIIFAVILFMTDYCGAFKIPSQVNHDFHTQMGRVLEKKIIDSSGKIVEYGSLSFETDKGIERIEDVVAPKLEKGDYVKIYYDKWYNFVSEINGKDVTGIYRWKPALLGESTVKARLFLTGYLIVFLIWQSVVYRKNRKDYRICQNKSNQFICGYDAETYGYIVWGTGLVLYTIVVILTIAGIGSTRWLGRGMAAFFYLYNLGYMFVFIGQSRRVIYDSNEILIKETSGYIRKYVIEDINYISEIKLNRYRIVFKDDFAQYIGIHNEYQKNVLKELAGGTFEKDIYYD